MNAAICLKSSLILCGGNLMQYCRHLTLQVVLGTYELATQWSTRNSLLSKILLSILRNVLMQDAEPDAEDLLQQASDTESNGLPGLVIGKGHEPLVPTHCQSCMLREMRSLPVRIPRREELPLEQWLNFHVDDLMRYTCYASCT